MCDEFEDILTKRVKISRRIKLSHSIISAGNNKQIIAARYRSEREQITRWWKHEK